MNNTALRAEKEITNTIIFRNEKHKDFYQTYMKKCRRQDVYHKALIYCLGISEDTRVNIDRIYDLGTGYVKTECLQEGWQTSGSVRIVRMAFLALHHRHLRHIQNLFGLTVLLIHQTALFCLWQSVIPMSLEEFPCICKCCRTGTTNNSHTYDTGCQPFFKFYFHDLFPPLFPLFLKNHFYVDFRNYSR